VLRIGLTGGIACGKSRVRRRLATAGFGTLDLDAVAHEMIAPGGPAYADVVSAFGAGILASDGTVDRKALGSRVFADAAARAELNALVHPRVRDEEARRAAAHAAAGGRVFVTDAALLVEAGLHLRFDRLVVVDCDGGEQLRRLIARDRLDEAAARGRIAAPMPAAE
jgi:dephospho-CoA kinase